MITNKDKIYFMNLWYPASRALDLVCKITGKKLTEIPTIQDLEQEIDNLVHGGNRNHSTDFIVALAGYGSRER